MKLTSESIVDQQWIPARYAFGKIDPQSHVTLAQNVNPQLAWQGAPQETKSFAVICHDVDVPSKPDDVNQEQREIPSDLPRVDFYHWVLRSEEHTPGLLSLMRNSYADFCLKKKKTTIVKYCK